MTDTNAKSQENMPLTEAIINGWADNPNDAVALHLKQKLLPVEGEGGVIFPPTYADIGYNIDTLSDGTKVATIDSVGSQANRMEPIFKREPYSKLVPQIEIELHTKGDGGDKLIESRSILDLAHRGADAVVHASPTLAKLMQPAFLALRRGDAGPLCQLAPTSLVFGVWDSRGGSGEKRPRLIRSIIRAWDVDQLFAAAQFNSIWKYLDDQQKDALKAEEKLPKRHGRSDVGLADAPSSFRKVGEAAARQMPEFRNGSPNPERRILGGVIARGPIERDVTINLVALRAICGTIEQKENKAQRDKADQTIRRYLLSLALVAATADEDLFLREGCHLRYAGSEQWDQVPRRGAPAPVDLTSPEARQTILNYAKTQAKNFVGQWLQGDGLIHKFDLAAAKKLLAKKDGDEAAPTS